MMNINLNPIVSLASYMTTSVVSRLTVEQKTIAVAAIAFSCLAICYAIIRSCCFNAKPLFSEQSREEIRRRVDELEKMFEEFKQDSAELELENQRLLNLQERIGPFSPKYQPTKEELERLEPVQEGSEKGFSPAFKERYQGLVMAPEVFKRGFIFALENTYRMVGQGILQLNGSIGTPKSKGAIAVYRFLACDWIKEGILSKSCHGYALYLNEEMSLVASLPEKVLKNKGEIITHFGARCDFIPGEDILKHTSAASGIDPIAAKCLWAKLNQEDQRHFLHWILEPAMREDCPAYVAACNYMKSLPRTKRQEMTILRDLIDDIAVALMTKFDFSIALNEWGKYLHADDLELQPFVKQEVLSTTSLPEDGENEAVISWQLNYEFLVAVCQGIPTQFDFYALMLQAYDVHQVYFDHLSAKLMLHPMSQEQIIKTVSWDHLKQCYYKVHKFIGGHGCLLSGFFNALMVNTADLTSENVDHLKRAMATYLDDPRHAEEFEQDLKSDLGSSCTIEKFKEWLRGENALFDATHFTPTVLEIAAYTVGVRVALFALTKYGYQQVSTQGKGDEFGRLVPVEEGLERRYFGPPTQEIIFMAVENGYSYYALFPKINEEIVLKEKGISIQDQRIIKDLNHYWKTMETHN